MARPWYRSAYMRLIQPVHELGLIPFCLDCRLLRKARHHGEFYTHDEPSWHVVEALASGIPVRVYRTCVDIDLNVRVRGNQTLVGIEDVHGSCEIGEPVMVRETESGITGVGEIVDIDHDRRVVYLRVEWGSLTAPPALGTQAVGSGQTWSWDPLSGLRRTS